MARRILAILLLAMAAGQVSDLTGFVDVLVTYDLGGRTTAWALAIPIVLTEAVAGVGLLRRTGVIRHLAPAMAVAVALGWTVLAAQALLRGLALDDCGCFGVRLAQPLRWWVFLEVDPETLGPPTPGRHPRRRRERNEVVVAQSRFMLLLARPR